MRASSTVHSTAELHEKYIANVTANVTRSVLHHLTSKKSEGDLAGKSPLAESEVRVLLS